MAWIDCHTHLDGLSDVQQQEVVARAEGAGVRWMINASDEETAWPRVQNLVERFDNVYGNLGVHPHHAKDVSGRTYETLERAIDHPKMIAVGEIGLDFYYDQSPRETQREVFRRQMEVALKKKKPVVVHHRDSSAAIVQDMKAFCERGLRGMIHCFSGSWNFAKGALDLGLFISFSGILTFRNALDTRDAALKVPLNRILVETDAPYLAPVPLRGTTNEPKNLVHTALYLAELRKISPMVLSEQILRNAGDLFGVPFGAP